MSMDELEVILDSGEKGDEKRSRRTKSSPAPAASTRTRWGWLVVAVIVIGAVILGLQLAQQNRVQPQPGEAAPLFTLTTFDGQSVSLADLKGKIVVVNFWASWCPPCHDEAPELKAIAEDYAGKNVVLIGVDWLDTDNEAKAFLARYGLTYLNGPDLGEKIARSYRVQGAPENYVIDRNGIIADTVIGPITYEHLSEVLDRLIASGGAS